jgi:hypothetical protein
MLDTNRLLEILDGWAQWMKKPTHRLGFPSRSLVMSSGGASTEDSFNELILTQDQDNIRIIDTLIHNLPPEQQDALYHKYLSSKKPFAYEYKLELAIDNLLTIASRKINA